MSSKNKLEKEVFDKANDNVVSTLFKHMNDWYQDHPGATFITPRDFQNSYPQWDKYSSDSFRKQFYKLKKIILDGKIYSYFIFILLIAS